MRYLSYGEELYDLAADPGELRNLAREPRAAAGANASRARAGRLDPAHRRSVPRTHDDGSVRKGRGSGSDEVRSQAAFTAPASRHSSSFCRIVAR